MTPKVSVIMCVYNAEHCVQATLESILHQVYPNMEVLILDNDSQDATVDVIKKNNDPRIHLFQVKKNL